jgi:hypothetical protein
LVRVAPGVGEAASVSDTAGVETEAFAIRLGVGVRIAVGLAVAVAVAVEESEGEAGWGVPLGVAGATVAGGSVGGELNTISGSWLQAASERMHARPRIREGNTIGRTDDMRGKLLRELVPEEYDGNQQRIVPDSRASIT